MSASCGDTQTHSFNAMIEAFWSNVDGEVETAFLGHVCHFPPTPTPTWDCRIWGSEIADNYRRFSFLVSHSYTIPDPKKPELCKEWKPREVLGERLQPVWNEALARYWREKEQVRQVRFRDELMQRQGYRPLSWLLHHDVEKKRARALEEAVGSREVPVAKRQRVEDGGDRAKDAKGDEDKNVKGDADNNAKGDEDKNAKGEGGEDEDEDSDGETDDEMDAGGETDDEVCEETHIRAQPKARRNSGGS